MGEGLQDLAVYLESCRTKRNIGAYDRSGSISRSEAAELLKEARAFRETVVAWLRDNHPEFIDQGYWPVELAEAHRRGQVGRGLAVSEGLSFHW
jgi:hypothetical protein